MGAGRALTVTYIDTSALIRLLTGTGDLALVEEALRQQPATSTLTDVEMLSAIYRRWRQGVESETERDKLLEAVARRINPAVTSLPLTGNVLREAGRAIRAYPVRSLDAIHLATAIIAARHARRHGAKLRFCTADHGQAAAAETLLGTSNVILVPSLE
jgi:predicted nucleic acid-binding protein